MSRPREESTATPLRNQLEPASLLRQFAEHPPAGFAPLTAVAQQPAFQAPFDLLTTAEDALRDRVRAWPLSRWWLRVLTIRTAFIGSTVTEYAPLARGVDAASLATTLRSRVAPGYRLTIVKDLPVRSPLLSAEDNAYADALTGALEREGFVMVEGQALAYVPIDFADRTDYLSRLSPSRRKNLKRKLRSQGGLTVQRVPTGAAFADEARIDEYYAMYMDVFAQSEVHFDCASRAYLAAVLRDGSNGGIVFEYYSQGMLIGWNLCFVMNGCLVDKTIGLRYPQSRDHNLYFVSWFVNLDYAREQGLTHYIAGWTDPAVKAQLGARFTMTRHAVFVRNPLLRALARRFKSHFEADQQWGDPDRVTQ